MIKKMEKEFILGNQEIDIQGNLRMIIGMGMEKCIGEMEPTIKDNG